MKERITQAEVYETQPAVAKALIGLIDAAIQAGIEPSLIQLVKVRASQINGCALCTHMNIDMARKGAEQQARLDVLSMWREVPIFKARERAALHWTEVLTTLAEHNVSEQDYALVAQVFSKTEIINLTAVIVSINGWNRFGKGFHWLPQISA